MEIQMKLSYWVATQYKDSQCYNIRAKTKKEVVAILNSGEYRPSDYDFPKKVTVEYRDAFDLMEQCMNEGSGSWEA